MSSLIRNLQRKHLRKGTFTTNDAGEPVKIAYEPKPQRTMSLPDGGYVTVRYTKGFRRVSARRLRAQGHVAHIMHGGATGQQDTRMARAIVAMQAAEANEKRIAALLLQPVHAITRQMRRHALRSGRDLPPLIGSEPKAKPARKPRAKKAASEQQAA